MACINSLSLKGENVLWPHLISYEALLSIHSRFSENLGPKFFSLRNTNRGIGLSVFIHIKKNNTVAGDHSLSYIILSLPRGKSFEFIIQGEVDPFTCLVVPSPLTAKIVLVFEFGRQHFFLN